MNVDALKKLADAVEAGRVGQFRNLDSEFGQGNGIHAKRAYNGSLDAAKALHDAVLPGWFPGISKNIHSGFWFAWVQTVDQNHHSATEKDPARAWLLAIIRALIAQAGGDVERPKPPTQSTTPTP